MMLLLCSCTGTEKEEEPLSIVTPQGAPVLAFYDQIENENYSRVAASAISALWTGEQSPDVLVADLTSGVQAIASGADYQLAAVITFGNLYLASTGNDEDETIDADDHIVLFGTETMLPYRIWHYLYGDAYDANIFYEASATEAAAALASGKDSQGETADYVFLAQPALAASMKKNASAEIFLDVQEAYLQKAGTSFVQAAVFVKKSADHEQIEDFLNDLEESIEKGIADPALVEEGLSVYEGDEAVAQYGFNPTIVVDLLGQKNSLGLNMMGLGYEKAIDIKEDIDAMLKVFDIAQTDEEIYFQ